MTRKTLAPSPVGVPLVGTLRAAHAETPKKLPQNPRLELLTYSVL